MVLYDSNNRGNWTLSLAEAFIPRFLWPDKPNAVSQGRILNRTVTGNSDANTQVGASVYADGYWQFGWPGTIVFSAIMGLILGLVTRITYVSVLRTNLIYLPVVLLGMQLATLGPTGYLQKSIVGPLPIFLGYLFVVFMFQEFLTKLGPTPNHRTRPFPDRMGARR